MREQLLNGQTNVLGDLTQQVWGNVAPAVIWDGRSATIGMAELLVRTALAYFNKPQSVENRNDFARLEDRNAGHLVDDYGLRSDKLGFELRVAVIEKHCDHFLEIGVQLVECGALAMRSGKPGNVAHVQIRFGGPFNHRGIAVHGAILKMDVGPF